MSKATVALTRCPDYTADKVSNCLKRQFDLLGGLSEFVKSGDSVLIKPNFISPKSADHATQTHPVVIIELAKLLLNFGAKPFVADSPAWQNTFACAKKLRLDESLKKIGVPVKQLDAPQKCIIGDSNTKVRISKDVLDADVIINLPKFKSHQQVVATFAVKNMFGCVPGKRKPLWHFRLGGDEQRFCKLLIDIFRYINPALTIIDGVMAMDGPGPINGRTRPLGWLIGSKDPIACERVCAMLINKKPNEFPIIRTANKIGMGCSHIEEIQITGDVYNDYICTDFEFPAMIPIRFSLAHVCKSVAKQIIMLLRPASKRL